VFLVEEREQLSEQQKGEGEEKKQQSVHQPKFIETKEEGRPWKHKILGGRWKKWLWGEDTQTTEAPRRGLGANGDRTRELMYWAREGLKEVGDNEPNSDDVGSGR